MGEGLTIVLTIVSGVFVYIICELAKEIWLTPLQTYKDIKGRISYFLVFYADKISNPIISATASKDDMAEYSSASLELRKLAAEVAGFAQIVSIRWGIPKNSTLFEVQKYLVGLSNGMFATVNSYEKATEFNDKRILKMKELLKIL